MYWTLPGTWSMTVLSTPATAYGGVRKQDNQNVGGEYLWYSDILTGLHTTQDTGRVTWCGDMLLLGSGHLQLYIHTAHIVALVTRVGGARVSQTDHQPADITRRILSRLVTCDTIICGVLGL